MFLHNRNLISPQNLKSFPFMTKSSSKDDSNSFEISLEITADYCLEEILFPAQYPFRVKSFK